jgi:hypothetical protein
MQPFSSILMITYERRNMPILPDQTIKIILKRNHQNVSSVVKLDTLHQTAEALVVQPNQRKTYLKLLVSYAKRKDIMQINVLFQRKTKRRKGMKHQ